ncbi:MAG: 3-phosphoshikimate 1-carboxyvinyltransferase [Candidatus Omnitrophica bacterium]|nr:3-phosphoshikimate 1-carboxyvinyltransferase [Candidatus Omnitrophota bacterium]
MSFFVVKPLSRIKGIVDLPGDKSIAHRAIILSAIAKGKTLVKNFPLNKDCLSTIEAIRKLGVRIIKKEKDFVVSGKGLSGLTKPKSPIFIEESGTTFRLFLGLLAGQSFQTTLIAGKSLSNRPMLRVNAPLRLMGAKICANEKKQAGKPEDYPPIVINGGKLKPIEYSLPVASAQVKSALLLAALYAKGETKIIEPVNTRDHTERMLKMFKADIETQGSVISLKGGRELESPNEVFCPGDISSASFFIVASIVLPDSEILIKNVCLNPSRLGVINVLKRMGVDIEINELRGEEFEPIGDLLAKSSNLKSTIIKKEEIPTLIDELPVLMVAASFAKGKSVFEGVEELRVKETDRIQSMCDGLKKMGVDIFVVKSASREDVVINGGNKLKGNEVRSFGDHRTAMSLIIAGLAADGETRIDDVSCIDKSFPDFLKILKNITK